MSADVTIPAARRRTDPYASPDERFVRKVRVADDGCWQWLGSLSVKGYGHFYADRDRGVIRAHRWAYERLVGPIPEGLTLDHLCRNTSCVNPAHLEPVSSGTNTLRGDAVSARNARKTHCIRDHEFTPENTRIDHKGGRVCVQCKRERDNRSQRNRRAAA